MALCPPRFVGPVNRRDRVKTDWVSPRQGRPQRSLIRTEVSRPPIPIDSRNRTPVAPLIATPLPMASTHRTADLVSSWHRTATSACRQLRANNRGARRGEGVGYWRAQRASSYFWASFFARRGVPTAYPTRKTVVQWDRADLNRGQRHPRPQGYQATPRSRITRLQRGDLKRFVLARKHIRGCREVVVWSHYSKSVPS